MRLGFAVKVMARPDLPSVRPKIHYSAPRTEQRLIARQKTGKAEQVQAAPMRSLDCAQISSAMGQM